MYLVIMTGSDSCRGESRASGLVEMEIAIINARMMSRAKIKTVFVLFPTSQGNVFLIFQTDILFRLERMVHKKDFQSQNLKNCPNICFSWVSALYN